jgi:DDE superfamily endonuclease
MMDNLPSHKVKTITPLIERVGARILHMSRYSPEFNPIEHLVVSELVKSVVTVKSLLKAVPADNIKDGRYAHRDSNKFKESKHLQNWFTHSCYRPL